MGEMPSAFRPSTPVWVERNVHKNLEHQVFQPISPDTLVRTKLFIPQYQHNQVARPRLVKKLMEGAERPLTLLSAPPGFGKTTLLSEWASLGSQNTRGKNLPVAWLTLDEQDNDPNRLGNYLLAALATVGISLDGDVLEGVNAANNPFEALLSVISNQALLSGMKDKSGKHAGLVLVLDDYHFLVNRSIQKNFSYLLTHLPPQLHLIIATRADPPLPLAQLRARDQLMELRAGDLRFYPAEARDFLREKMDLDLSEEVIALLDSKTEGWIAGLQFAALAMQKKTGDIGGWAREGSSVVRGLSSLVGDFGGGHHFLVDYLAEQVLDQQPVEVQQFLLYTSILERLNASLCAALLSESWLLQDADITPALQTPTLRTSQDMLEYLERANLFVVALDEKRQWYRYHPLFASFLQERLQRIQPESWLALHRRAAEIFEGDGLVAEAVNHILAVGNTDQAVQMIENIAEEIWMSGEMVRLLGWLEALPEDLLHTHPRLCIYHAWILNILGEFEATSARLQAAQTALENNVDEAPADQAITRGMLNACRAIVAIMEGETATAIELSQQALEDLPENYSVWRSVAIRNLGNAYLLSGETERARQSLVAASEISQKAGNLYMSTVCLYEIGELQIVQGQLYAARDTFFQALDLAARQGSPGFTLIGAVHVGLSEVLREWNELELGLLQVLTGLNLGVRGRSLGIQVCGLTRLGLLKMACGDRAEAVVAFQRAALLAPHRRRTSFVAHHDIQASLWGRQPNTAAALHWAQEIGLLKDMEVTGELNFRNESSHIALVRIFLALGRLDEAFQLTERLAETAGQAGRLGRLIEILVLQAHALQSMGRHAKSLETLVRALTLAEPQGYVRLFLDEGETMRKLLIQGGRLQVAASIKAYIERLLAAFNQPGEYETNLGPAALYEPLSERELEILRLVAAGLKNNEIAQNLVLAPSTIHWHVKNIYSKLSVHSRTQAVSRAAGLGLLGQLPPTPTR